MPRYTRYFAHYVDKRSVFEKALNFLNESAGDVGRSFALIAGVSDYPNMRGPDRRLAAAAEDLRKLEVYLRDYEFFDEIVILRNAEVSTENLEYFLQTYFPERLRKFPRSRFLFAYTGHGMTEGTTGYVLKHSASRLDDRTQAISLTVVRAFMDDVIRYGHHVLVLINACHSGEFLRRSLGEGGRSSRNPGAHAITSGAGREVSWAIPSVGTGSVFFETFFAALDGRADTTPADGLITAWELSTYLHEEVQFATKQAQSPQFGDMSPEQSQGQFFFLNRQRLVTAKAVSSWNPSPPTPMGAAIQENFSKGEAAYADNDFTTAMAHFTAAARAGHAEGMAWAGYLYQHGLGASQDVDRALEWYEKAARAGNRFAMTAFADLYLEGQVVDQDYGLAWTWYERAAGLGDAAAMRTIGQMYERGLGVKQDDVKAIEWYEKAASAGDAAALNNAGYFYQVGRGAKQDLKRAIEYYEKAADAGEGYAMENLGVLYRDAIGVKQDYAAALKWFEKAAIAGMPGSMRLVGYAHEVGQGVNVNPVQAAVWYEKAALLGDVYAQAYLGNFYRLGLGVRQNYTLAFQWLQKAALAGNSWGMVNLGVLYRDGLGVKRDPAQAFEWIQKAAADRVPIAVTNVGYAFEHGLGVAKDLEKARESYEQAALLNESWAMYRLGWMFENGIGVPRDLARARDWYEKGGQRGEALAQEALRRLPVKE